MRSISFLLVVSMWSWSSMLNLKEMVLGIRISNVIERSKLDPPVRTLRTIFINIGDHISVELLWKIEVHLFFPSAIGVSWDQRSLAAFLWDGFPVLEGRKGSSKNSNTTLENMGVPQKVPTKNFCHRALNRYLNPVWIWEERASQGCYFQKDNIWLIRYRNNSDNLC